MTAVFAQMQGNQIGTRILSSQGGRNRIRIGGVSLLAQGRNVINIDA
jgi:hypothetical protein